MSRTTLMKAYHITITLSCALLLTFASSSQGQVASALLQENGLIPNDPNNGTSTLLSTVTANHVGGYACIFTSSVDGSMVWGSATDSAGGVLRVESTIGDFTQGSIETSGFGMANDGTLSYGTTDTNNITLETGLDALWFGDTRVLGETEAVSSFPGQFSVFNSRPGASGSAPFWVGGIGDLPAGPTSNRVLFLGTDSTPLLAGGDAIGGTGLAHVTTGMDFDVRVSENGTHYIIAGDLEGAAATNDIVMVIDDNAIEIDGTPVREGSPVPLSAGGLAGELWANFDNNGVNDAGDYFFTGDTSAATTVDEFVVKNGVIVLREGELTGGFPINGAIEGGDMNRDGDWAVVWDVDGDTANIEVLIVNGEIVLSEGDLVDWNNDGVVDGGDNNGKLADFTGSANAVAVSARKNDGTVDIYFTADIDFNGTPSTTDDSEGFMRINVAAEAVACTLGDVNGDTLVDSNDVVPFALVLLFSDSATALELCGADVNEDGEANGADAQLFIDCILNGGCP